MAAGVIPCARKIGGEFRSRQHIVSSLVLRAVRVRILPRRSRMACDCRPWLCASCPWTALTASPSPPARRPRRGSCCAGTTTGTARRSPRDTAAGSPHRNNSARSVSASRCSARRKTAPRNDAGPGRIDRQVLGRQEPVIRPALAHIPRIDHKRSRNARRLHPAAAGRADIQALEFRLRQDGQERRIRVRSNTELIILIAGGGIMRQAQRALRIGERGVEPVRRQIERNREHRQQVLGE